MGKNMKSTIKLSGSILSMMAKIAMMSALMSLAFIRTLMSLNCKCWYQILILIISAMIILLH